MTAYRYSRLRQLLLASMKPIAGLVMKIDVGAAEFVEIVKAAFVFSATDEYGRNGRAASVAQVSRVTGLTRREVTRLKDKFHDRHNTDFTNKDIQSKALSYWHTDPEFLDEFGYPANLKFGPGESSFLSLLNKHVPDVDPSMLIQELVDGSFVEELSDGSFKALQRNTSFSDGFDGAIVSLDTGLRCMAYTIKHNADSDNDSTWLQRNVHSDSIGPARRAYVRRFVRERATEFCVGIDDLFNASSSTADDSAPRHTIGIGLFYYEIDEEA